MINQVLTEMDGMNAKKNVFIIGATNRYVTRLSMLLVIWVIYLHRAKSTAICIIDYNF